MVKMAVERLSSLDPAPVRVELDLTKLMFT
jgi:hypothetical protein